ncbi:MAG: hypothetical protein ACEPO2_22020 [Pelagibaca sp.]
MTQGHDEAAPLARLLGADIAQTVGWVFLWPDMELAILWLDRSKTVLSIDPPLSEDLLNSARARTPRKVIALLVPLCDAARAPVK